MLYICEITVVEIDARGVGEEFCDVSHGIVSGRETYAVETDYAIEAPLRGVQVAVFPWSPPVVRWPKTRLTVPLDRMVRFQMGGVLEQKRLDRSTSTRVPPCTKAIQWFEKDSTLRAQRFLKLFWGLKCFAVCFMGFRSLSMLRGKWWFVAKSYSRCGCPDWINFDIRNYVFLVGSALSLRDDANWLEDEMYSD